MRSNLVSFPSEKAPKISLGIAALAAQMEKPGTPKVKKVQWDHMVPGLGLRFNKNGNAVFLMRYYFNGKQVWKTFGDIRIITLDQARLIALRVKQVVSQRQDPKFIFDELLPKPAKTSSITFGQFGKIFINQYAQIFKKSWREDEKRLNRQLLCWAYKPLNEITRADWASFNVEYGKDHPVGANRIRELVSVMFKQAIIMGYLPDGYRNPTWGVREFREEPRDRYISEEEMPTILNAIKSFPCQRVRTAVMLALHLGLRRSEILKMKWEWVDFQKKEIRVPMTKSGRPHVVPLSDEVIRLLNLLPRTSPPLYVLPGDKGNHMSASVLERGWEKIREYAGVPDVRFHDIRRTVGCWTVQKTNDLMLVGAILNHSEPGVTARHYAKYKTSQVRTALDDHSRAIEDCRGTIL